MGCSGSNANKGKKAPVNKTGNAQQKQAPTPVVNKDQALLDALKKHGVSDNTKIDANLSIFLKCKENMRGVLGFLKDLHNLDLPKLRKLSISDMDDLQKKDLEDFEKTVKNSKFKEIDILYLHGGGKLNMDRFEDCIPALLQNTDTQIYLDSFNLDQQDIETIFKHATKTQSLHIINCKVSDLQDIKIPKSQAYKMKTLDLYWTAIEEDEEYLNEEKMEELAVAIATSKLKD